jgi:hypothetical protein
MGIFSAPLRGLVGIFEEVRDLAEKELYGEDAVREELTEMYRQLEAGSITEEEFNRCEAKLVMKLEEIAERREKAGRSDG